MTAGQDNSLEYVNGAGTRRPRITPQVVVSTLGVGFAIAAGLGGVWYGANERLYRLEGVVEGNQRSFESFIKYRDASVLLNFTAKDARVLVNDIGGLAERSAALSNQVSALRNEVTQIERKVYKLSAEMSNLPPVEWQRMILENERDILNLSNHKRPKE